MKDYTINLMRVLMMNIILLLSSVSLITADTVFAETTEAVSNADFVLVIDCSGSMIDNDQQNLTVEAAEFFVSQLPLEKARLAVIVFGNDYGDEHYRDPVWETDKDSPRGVKVAYGLTEIDSEDERARAKEKIKNEVNRDGAWTPLGYAFEAAVRTLNDGKANKGKAAIILITDGQVDGENDYRPNGMDYYSIDSAVERAAKQDWPVYCMELNYKGENRKGDGLPGIAYHLMREYIPVKTGTTPIELKSADQAKMEMLNIVKKYFDPDSPKTTIYSEEEKIINISDIVAEENINIVGDMSKVTSIELVSPEGKQFRYENIHGEWSTEEGVVYFDESSALIKLIMPGEGDWRITVHSNGDTKLTFEMVPIAIREMDLNLSASVESGEIDRGTTIDFNAAFSYSGKAYGYEQFYSKTNARLIITGTNNAEVMMTSDGSSYTASYCFDKAGSYYAQVVVDFPSSVRSKEKKSIEEYHYVIEVKETLPKGSVEPLVLKVGGDTKWLDMSEYYESPDGSALVYSVKQDNDISGGDLGFYIDEQGKLSVTPGKRSGIYNLKVGACDGKGEKEVWQSVDVTVSNSRIKLKGDGKPVNITLLADGSDEFVLRYADYFSDEDNTSPIIQVRPVSPQDEITGGMDQDPDGICYKYDQDEEKLVIRGVEVGKGDINIQAIDGNDVNEWEVFIVKVNVISPVSAALTRFRIPLIAACIVLAVSLAFLLYSRIGRKIYGSWRIEFPDGQQLGYPDEYSYSGEGESFEIYRMNHCKRSVVILDNVLSDVGRQGGFGSGVKLVAGSKRSGDVYLKGIEKLDSCELNGDLIDKKTKKLCIKPYFDVVLKCEKAELNVKLERVR